MHRIPETRKGRQANREFLKQSPAKCNEECAASNMEKDAQGEGLACEVHERDTLYWAGSVRTKGTLGLDAGQPTPLVY